MSDLGPNEPGYRLRNGALLLATKPMDRMRLRNPAEGTEESIVLAFAPGTFEPFCCWRRTRLADGNDSTWAGDYFTTLERAWVGFQERS